MDYDKAVDINPNYATVYSNRGKSHTALGNNDKALIDYNKADRKSVV